MKCLSVSVILIGLIAGCRQRPPRAPTPEEVRLRTRAEVFLRETLSAIRPGAEVKKLEKNGQYQVGDLFNAGHDVCVASFIEEEKARKSVLRVSRGPVFYSRRSGEWELRACYAERGFHPSRALGLMDMSGDGVSEVLFCRGLGATGNSSENIYKYSAGADSLICAARGLSRPRSHDDGTIESYSKAGALCGGWSEHKWHGDRLVKRREGGHHTAVRRYLVGPGVRVSTIEYAEYGPDGKETYSWEILGNLPGTDGGEGGLPENIWEPLDDILLYLKTGGRRRRVRIRVDAKKAAEALGFDPKYKAWRWPILGAVRKRPEKFSADTPCGEHDAKISDFAAVEIKEDFRGIATYEVHHLSDDDIEKLPALSAPFSVTVSTRRPIRKDKPLPLTSRHEAYLSIRGPDVRVRTGGLVPDLGGLFVVRSVRVEGKAFHVDCEVRPSRVNVPHWPEKTFQPVGVLNLGKLRPGRYKTVVTVRDARGAEKPPRRIECSFRVSTAAE